jgi:hypothetical protein
MKHNSTVAFLADVRCLKIVLGNIYSAYLAKFLLYSHSVNNRYSSPESPGTLQYTVRIVFQGQPRTRIQ